MNIVNGRLLINENEIDIDCEKLKNIMQKKLDELEHPNVIVDVEFDNECYNESTNCFWCEIDVNLYTSSGILGNIQFTTEGIAPSLVFINDKYEFIYVFEQSSYTCTNPINMTNTGHTDLKCDKYLETLLLEDLYDKLG